jgi:uncharacterized HAD superfamily protein
VDFEQIFSFDLGLSFGLSPEDTAELMRQMHEPDVLRALKPVPGAARSLRRWKRAGWEISIVTGRPPSTRTVSEDWLRDHDVPADHLIFVNKYARTHSHHGGEKAVRLDELRAMPFTLAVEDSPCMIRFVADEMNIPVVILDRPWNRSEPERAGAAPVVRCRTWQEISAKFR